MKNASSFRSWDNLFSCVFEKSFPTWMSSPFSRRISIESRYCTRFSGGGEGAWFLLRFFFPFSSFSLDFFFYFFVYIFIKFNAYLVGFGCIFILSFSVFCAREGGV